MLEIPCVSCVQKAGLISCPLEVQGVGVQSGAKGRGRARSFASALGGSSRALVALRVKEAGGRQDQSTFRIIFEICSGKGSDVRY